MEARLWEADLSFVRLGPGKINMKAKAIIAYLFIVFTLPSYSFSIQNYKRTKKVATLDLPGFTY